MDYFFNKYDELNEFSLNNFKLSEYYYAIERTFGSINILKNTFRYLNEKTLAKAFF